jgi:hypothetical protein
LAVSRILAKHPDDLKTSCWISAQEIQELSAGNEIQIAVFRNFRGEAVRFSGEGGGKTNDRL